MEAQEWMTEQFEQSRGHLHAVAHRMLGSAAEADDAVQETWLRLSRADTEDVHNLQGWLTTVLSRICLDMLRARRARREDLVELWPAEGPIAGQPSEDPEQAALMTDSVGVALLVVLETLPPDQRLAFVLHDMFGMPFEEIAPIVDRGVDPTRQLASRGRRRVRGAAAQARPETLVEQRRVIDAFLAAAREGDFEALVEVLSPDIVFRADRGRAAAAAGVPAEVHGQAAVADVVLERGRRFAPFGRPALVGGGVGIVAVSKERVLAVISMTVSGGRITAIDLVANPERLRHVRI